MAAAWLHGARGVMVASGVLATGHARRAAPDAYVRINQLGYEAGLPATAYLVTEAPSSGVSFRIIGGHGAVLSGHTGPTTGAWGRYSVAPLDFTLLASGRYTIEVAGPAHAISPPFSVGEPATLYASALRNARAFYRSERDGPDYIPGPLRTAPSRLNDASAAVYETPPVSRGKIVGDLVPTGAVIDASGGWWDAGDYLKFVETTSYTVAMLLTGIRDFPDQMGEGSQADFTAEAQFGLRWLLKMWDDPNRILYYEVGIGIDFQAGMVVSDHDLWRLPQRDDTLGGQDPRTVYIRHRPVFAAGPAGALISPNLAGRLAASFALGFLEFRSRDPDFARRCLLAAVHIFDLADTKPHRLLTALPYGFYPETEWRDDLEWGATELAIALTLAGHDVPPDLPHPDPAYYLGQAADFAASYIAGSNDARDTLNLYDVSGLAHFELYRAIDLAGRPFSLAVTQAALLADLGKQLARAEQTAERDPFGFGFDWAASDTTSHGAGLSVMADEYADLGGRGLPAGRATGWLGNILGANIWGLSFIIGDGAVFPNCPQHQVANLIGSRTGQTPVLLGAAVEGPNEAAAVVDGKLPGMRACPVGGTDRYRIFTGNGARFEDSVQNYVNTEPALDLTAASPLMFAWQIGRVPKPFAVGR